MIRKNSPKPLKHAFWILHLCFFPILAIIGAFIVNEGDIWYRFLLLMRSEAILMSDSIARHGLDVSLLNAGIVAFINIAIFYKLNLRSSGLLLATFFTVYGFSFLGMNPVNLIPIYLGGYLYSLYSGDTFKTIVLIVMISGTMAPIVSHVMFAYQQASVFTLLAGVLVGVAVGFIVVPMGRHLLRYHDGFNLYNIGFTGGMIAILYSAVASGLGFEAERVLYLWESHNPWNLVILLIGCLYFLFIAFFFDRNNIAHYPKLLRSSGRALSDFTDQAGFGASYLNMSVMGLLSTVIVLILKVPLNGLILSAIYTIIGFAAFGKHPRNSIPVMVGAILSSLVLGRSLSSSSILAVVLFSTTLAPIAGVYGPFWGIMAGFIHVFVASYAVMFYSGLNLYNNGFAGGLVAGFLTVVIQVFKGGQGERRNR